MKALLCREYGPPERLVLDEIESPAPGPREVRVRVHACGVNFPDVLMIQGKYQHRPEMPFAPGAEAAGEVLEVGAEVSGLAAGDRVIAMVGSGGFQEELLAEADRCLALPESMDYETGASFALTYGTGYHGLVDRGALAPGETLLVLGAAGGVGTAAVDIGKRLGARVIAAAGSDDKLAFLEARYGVDEVINYRTLDEPLKDRVNALTGGKGADVIYDPVGGEAFQQCLRCIRWGGRILVIGFAGDGEKLPEARTNLLLLKGSSLVGVFWGRFTREEPEKSAANYARLLAWHAEGKLAPNISHRYPLARGADALYALINREVVGKCVVVIDHT